MYYLGENASTANKHDGSGYGVRLGWGNGPFEFAVGSGSTRYLVGDADQSNVRSVECPVDQSVSSEDWIRIMCVAIEEAAICWCSLDIRVSMEEVVIAPIRLPLALRMATPTPMTPGAL